MCIINSSVSINLDSDESFPLLWTSSANHQVYNIDIVAETKS